MIEIEVVIAGYAGPAREGFEVVNLVHEFPNIMESAIQLLCSDYQMDFPNFAFSFSCRKDGTLDSPYDGIRELFEGEE